MKICSCGKTGRFKREMCSPCWQGENRVRDPEARRQYQNARNARRLAAGIKREVNWPKMKKVEA